jgi:hypothetical protein
MSELLNSVREIPDDVLNRMMTYRAVESNIWPARMTLVLVLEVERRRNEKS